MLVLIVRIIARWVHFNSGRWSFVLRQWRPDTSCGERPETGGVRRPCGVRKAWAWAGNDSSSFFKTNRVQFRFEPTSLSLSSLSGRGHEFNSGPNLGGVVQDDWDLPLELRLRGHFPAQPYHHHPLVHLAPAFWASSRLSTTPPLSPALHPPPLQRGTGHPAGKFGFVMTFFCPVFIAF